MNTKDKVLIRINSVSGYFYTNRCHTPIIMTVEEYETIRLIDLSRLNHEETSKTMGVAHLTVQKI